MNSRVRIQKISPYNKQRGSAKWCLAGYPFLSISRQAGEWQLEIENCPTRENLPPGMVRLRDQKMAEAESQRERLLLFSRPFLGVRFERLGELLEAITLTEEYHAAPRG